MANQLINPCDRKRPASYLFGQEEIDSAFVDRVKRELQTIEILDRHLIEEYSKTFAIIVGRFDLNHHVNFMNNSFDDSIRVLKDILDDALFESIVFSSGVLRRQPENCNYLIWDEFLDCVSVISRCKTPFINDLLKLANSVERAAYLFYLFRTLGNLENFQFEAENISKLLSFCEDTKQLACLHDIILVLINDGVSGDFEHPWIKKEFDERQFNETQLLLGLLLLSTDDLEDFCVALEENDEGALSRYRNKIKNALESEKLHHCSPKPRVS